MAAEVAIVCFYETGNWDRWPKTPRMRNWSCSSSRVRHWWHSWMRAAPRSTWWVTTAMSATATLPERTPPVLARFTMRRPPEDILLSFSKNWRVFIWTRSLSSSLPIACFRSHLTRVSSVVWLLLSLLLGHDFPSPFMSYVNLTRVSMVLHFPLLIIILQIFLYSS